MFRSKLDRRIMIEPDLSVVILRCVYYALYNNHRAEAMKAIQAMQKRARYEISAQVFRTFKNKTCSMLIGSTFLSDFVF